MVNLGRLYQMQSKILKVSSDKLLLYKNGASFYANFNSIYMTKEGKEYKLLTIPVGFFTLFLFKINILARLFRLGFSHFINVGRGQYFLIFNKKAYLFKDGALISLGTIKGSNPPIICFFHNMILYGEYKSNKDKEPINIWCLNLKTLQWAIIYTFHDVRHVHGVFYDKFTDTIWVTTGDSDKESRIIKTKDFFNSVEIVLSGSQQYRVVELVFTKEYIFFGSDSPTEKNFLYAYKRSDSSCLKLGQVSSSVFFGNYTGEHVYFSTAVEPSLINEQSIAEIWCISVIDLSIERIYTAKKDFYSMKYFQYGVINFIARDSKSLFFVEQGTFKHNSTFIIGN